MYRKLNEKIEMMTKSIHFAMLKLTLTAGTIPPLLISMINYFIYDLNDEAFLNISLTYAQNIVLYFEAKLICFGYIPQRKTLIDFRFKKHFRLPFNQKTPIGYLSLSLFNIIGMFCLIFTSVPILCLLIGSCWLFICFANDITNDLQWLSIGGTTKLKRRRMKEVMDRLCKIVQIHSDLKQLSEMLY